jgi:hypothetical protein
MPEVYGPSLAKFMNYQFGYSGGLNDGRRADSTARDIETKP